MTNDQVEKIARKHFSVFTPTPCKRKGYQEPTITARWPNVFAFVADLASAIEAEVSARCRAEGGGTSDEGDFANNSRGELIDYILLLRREVDSGSAPAAGTAQDAERLAFIAEHGAAVRWVGNARSNLAVWDQHFPNDGAGRLANLRASVDFAISAHAKAGAEPAA